MSREELLEEIHKLGVEYVISIDQDNILSLRFWVEDDNDSEQDS